MLISNDIVLVTLVSLGLGVFLSALNVRYRDIRHALPFFIQLGMFATPIIYPLSVIPERWRWVAAMNPMAAVVEGFRASLLGGHLDWASLAQCTAVTLLVLMGSALYFRSMEKSFADVI